MESVTDIPGADVLSPAEGTSIPVTLPGEPGFDIFRGINRKFSRILSLDGGGVRGVITAAVLVRLEDAIRDEICRRNNVPDKYRWEFDVHLGDFFDCIAGTSTGSIIAAYLVTRGAKGQAMLKDKTKYSTDIYASIRSTRREQFVVVGLDDSDDPKTPTLNDWRKAIREERSGGPKAPGNPSFFRKGSSEGVLAVYLSVAPKIFPQPRSSLGHVIQKLRNILAGPKYKPNGLEDILADGFGDMTLEDVERLKRTNDQPNAALLLPSYDLDLNSAASFYVENPELRLDKKAGPAPFGLVLVKTVVQEKNVLRTDNSESDNLMERSEILPISVEKEALSKEHPELASLLSDSSIPGVLPVSSHGGKVKFDWDPDLAKTFANFRLADAIRASTAAPTFLPAAHVHEYVMRFHTGIQPGSLATVAPITSSETRPVKPGENGRIPERIMVDGGVVANNPCMQALTFLMAHAANSKGVLEADSTLLRNTSILSLGTGQSILSLAQKANSSALGWASSIVDVTMNGSGNALQAVLDFVLHSALSYEVPQYLRIQKTYAPKKGDHFDKTLMEMDNSSETMLRNLEDVGDDLARDPEQKALLEQYVRTMIFDSSVP